MFSEQQRKGVNPLTTKTRSLLKRKAIRQFIKENGKHITQVESTFYALLEQKIKKAILKAIGNNASRKRLTQHELLGDGNSKEVSDVGSISGIHRKYSRQ